MCCCEDAVSSARCFDYATHIARPGDDVTLLFVKDSDKDMERVHHAHNDKLGDSNVSRYYQECIHKAGIEMPGINFKYVHPPKQSSIPETILQHSEDDGSPVDILILGSAKLTKINKTTGEPEVLGSVASQVARKTGAHVLIMKNLPDSNFA